MNCQRQTACKRQYLRHTLDERGQPVPQIVRQESAVRSRIRRQFLFVKRLRVIERLLRRITVNSVRVPLQRGQVVELGRLLFLLPAFNLLDRRLFAMAGITFTTIKIITTAKIRRVDSALIVGFVLFVML